ncbi:uncharacterized protein LOC107038770 [Diachasma alloeum]|uniref:uncharacterized protein LOC107038770 n=1 Tax=Diachasma alloeum TaxID=454923 RepID=UPI0007381F90|nr:uncharacterized protein LOC107038770 [Diachasma alloeum]
MVNEKSSRKKQPPKRYANEQADEPKKIRSIKKTVIKSGSVKKIMNSEKNYSVSDLQKALNAIGEGQTLRQAAKNFGVPKSTLYLKSRNFVPLECRKGPKTILSDDEESKIIKWMVFCAKVGFPVTKAQLLDCVQKHFGDKKTPFKNNRPGKHWYNAFMKRHSNLSKRIVKNLTSTQASVSEGDLRSWFSKVGRYLEKKSLLNIEADRVFNLDESSFMLVPKDNIVITERGAINVPQIVNGNEKACFTVLFTVAASGKMPPPMILFDLKTAPKKNILDQIPKGWGVGNTKRGCMTADSFFSYISNVFFEWLKDNNYVFPIVLYVNGHSFHLTLPLLDFCKKNQIELVVLCPNAAHIIQPLDVAVFHPLKESYRKILRQWRVDNNVVNVNKSMFAPILKLALDAVDLPDSIVNGFESCGLYPFNPDRIDYNIVSSPDAVGNCNSKHLDMLEYFENSLISQEALEEFKRNEFVDTWPGNLGNEQLFETWREIKRRCEEIDPEMLNDYLTVSSISCSLTSDSQDQMELLQIKIKEEIE